MRSIVRRDDYNLDLAAKRRSTIPKTAELTEHIVQS